MISSSREFPTCLLLPFRFHHCCCVRYINFHLSKCQPKMDYLWTYYTKRVLRFVNSKKLALKIGAGGASGARQATRYEDHFWPHTAVQVQTFFFHFVYAGKVGNGNEELTLTFSIRLIKYHWEKVCEIILKFIWD